MDYLLKGSREEFPDGVVLQIKRLVDSDEFKVEWRVNGGLDEDKSYYTNDLEDAQGTMAAMADRHWGRLEIRGFKRYRGG